MLSSTRWFGWITVVMVLHMIEQIIFGTVELDRLRYVLGIYLGWFHSADRAIVLLVTIGVGLIYLAMFGMLNGGRGRLAALEILGFFSAVEVHHVVESALVRGYTPGLATSIRYSIFGVLLMRAAIQEYRSPMLQPKSRGALEVSQ
jgi:hypothetical protein